MATKKARKKTARKKTASKKTSKKTSTRRARVKKEKIPYTPNAERLSYFIGQLIQGGFAGKTIPKENKGRRAVSQNLRQMAQQLDRQVHKTTT